jgi:hypothetical protein
MILVFSLSAVAAFVLWASGIIPGAIREYREFKDEMEETHNPFKENK